MTARATGPTRWMPAAGAGVVVVVGLGARQLPGAAGDLAGGVLYAVLIALLVALVAPRARPTTLGVVAFASCTAVELAQLTGIPATLVDAAPPLRYVLGTTFHAPDLAAYAAGAAVAAVGLAAARASGARKTQAPPDHGR